MVIVWIRYPSYSPPFGGCGCYPALHANPSCRVLNYREQTGRIIARADREIDVLVYDLDGLTQEQRRMVEEEAGGGRG